MRDSSRVCGRPWTLSYVKVLRYTHHQASDMLYQQTEENNLQTAKRRAEREAADHKQKTLRFVIVLLLYHTKLTNHSVLNVSSRDCVTDSIDHPRVSALLANRRPDDDITYELL